MTASPFVVDLHVHTTFGSLDSHLKPGDLGELARKAGLAGIALTEHSRQWPEARARELALEQGVVLFVAREWSSPLGHIIILGLGEGSPWEQRPGGAIARTLENDPAVHPRGTVPAMRQIVDDFGGFMVLAHPFRYFPGPDNILFGATANVRDLPVTALASHPVFELVDDIEVRNGGCTTNENRLASEVAQILGRTGVAGSDAHGRFELRGAGACFEARPQTTADLIEELRAGRYSPVLPPSH